MDKKNILPYGPLKGLVGFIKVLRHLLSKKGLVLKTKFFAVDRICVEFRKPREDCMIGFLLCWYFSDFIVLSYGQKKILMGLSCRVDSICPPRASKQGVRFH